jgi:hypothetical protein
MRHCLRIGLMAVMCALILTAASLSAQDVPGAVYKPGPVIGRMIDAGFIYGDSNYNAIIQASDGNVYYVICSHNKKSGAHLFRYDPRTEKTNMVADLTATVGEDRTKTINQGKVHSDIYEVNGKLYFGTHAGSWDMTYPGGHFLSYDLATGKFEDFGIGVEHQGLVAMTMDTKRMRMYAVTWPGYTFCYYDINSKKTKRWATSYAPVIMQGPRSIAVDPRTGNAYWHNMDDTIASYNFEKDDIETLAKPKFDAPMFHIPLDKTVGCVWRSIKWSEPLQKFYGIMYYSDLLFSLEPKTGELEIIDRIASGPNRKSGKTSYSTLAFEFSRDGKTLYYIAPAEVPQADAAASKVEELHLVTYNVPLRRYTDHGAIKLDDGRSPRYCQGLEVGSDGNLYFVAWIPFTDLKSDKGKKIIDLLYEGKPTLDVEKSGMVQEINLIRMKDPLAGSR